MPVLVKKAGAYSAVAGIQVKKNGVYSAVAGAFVKVGGAYQSVLGGAPAGTLRQVATSTFINTMQHALNKQANSRSPHYMRASAPTIQIVIPNWLVTGGLETNGNGTDTWTASLEYPAGTFTQITFGGNVSGVVAPGDNLISDAVAAPPKDAKFWVRMYVQTTGNIKFQQYYAGDGTAGLEAGVNTITDKTMGGAIAFAASRNAGMIMPCAIIANSTVQAFAVMGDSISVGRDDTATADVPLQGHLGREFGATYPTGHLGVSGDTMTAFLASKDKRMALALNYFTRYPMNFGINDTTRGDSNSTIASSTDSVIALFPANTTALCTMTPVTSAADGLSGVTATNGARVTENTRRKALVSVRAVYDMNVPLENNSNPEDGIWKAGMTTDGTHYTQQACIAGANYIDGSSLAA